MADLHQATERLQAALDRIERAVERDGSTPAAGDLQAALRSARSENAQLQDVARRVADRLDGTIARLKNTSRI
jgi:uncharacterized protein YukE